MLRFALHDGRYCKVEIIADDTKDAPTIEQEGILVHCVVCPPGVPQDDRFQQYKTEEWMQRGRTESSLQYYRYVFHPSVPAGHLPSSGGNPTNTIIA
jgi:hypothetical protein